MTMNFESGKGQMSEAGLRLDGCTYVQLCSIETRKGGSCGSDKTCDVVQTVGQEGTSGGGLQVVPGPGKGCRKTAKVGEARHVYANTFPP